MKMRTKDKNKWAVLLDIGLIFCTVIHFNETAAKDFSISKTPVYSYKIIEEFPHDPSAYTQGLVFTDGILYEGTGLNGQSTIKKIDLNSGLLYKKYDLAPQFFGEGITIFKNNIFQLTWRSFVGFIYDKNSFTPLKQFYYPTEGWGITNDGKNLIMSDGSSSLYFMDPEKFQKKYQINVYDDTGPVMYLNELEFVKGEIYANIYPTNRIACIELTSGLVNKYIDLSGLLSHLGQVNRIDVLNGIAYDTDEDRLFVTGKYWPKLFEIKIVPPKDH